MFVKEKVGLAMPVMVLGKLRANVAMDLNTMRPHAVQVAMGPEG